MLQVFKSEAHAFHVTSKCSQNMYENPVARQMSDVRCRIISGAFSSPLSIDLSDISVTIPCMDHAKKLAIFSKLAL